MATEMVKAEEANPSGLNSSFQGMVQLPIVRQLGLLVGLAASIALGVYMVLWSQEPNYTVLYNQASPRDASQVINVLQSHKIQYQVDTNSGVIMVESGKLHEARMILAEQNLPSDTSGGFEFIKEPQGFTTNNFIQNKRYQVALQNELAKTIMWMSVVDNARVHLALPKQSAFLSDRRKPSASVLLDLSTGGRLEDEQVEAIKNLVASSIANLDSENVTVVDEKGRLLSDTNGRGGIDLSSRQLDYKRQVEQGLTFNIENILSPIVGEEKVRAQVVAEMDFTQLEMTQESFNPDLPAVRSEQRVEERSQGSAIQGGIPGALTNEPPGVAQAPERAGNAANGEANTSPSKSSVRYTINNELDRSIVHRRNNPAVLKRLSVAVVLDHKKVKELQAPEGAEAAEGEEVEKVEVIVPKPYTAEELERFTALVKEAVGFNALRGDTVNVINAEFIPPTPIEEVPESFLDQPWVWDLSKQLIGGLLAVLVLFGVIRPAMRNLSTIPAVADVSDVAEIEGDGLADDEVTLSGENGPRLPKPNEYESDLEMAKSMVVQEPKRVAQVVKQWVNEE